MVGNTGRRPRDVRGRRQGAAGIRTGHGPDEGTRLQKYLAHAGVAARRRSETDFIEAARVTVDGRLVTDPSVRVRPGQVVRVDGRVVRPETPVMLLLHKPAGVVSAALDRQGRRTAVDLVAEPGVRLYPVGRLDTDSEGLLLLTNDGALTHALLHPRHRVPRIYCALVRPRPDPAVLMQLERGVRLSDGPARAEDVRTLGRGPRGIGPGPGAPDAVWISMALREGRNREARRMCAAVGLEVLRLIRTRFGGLQLGTLSPGEARRLSTAEVAALWRDAGVRPRAVGTASARSRTQPGGRAPEGRAPAAVPDRERNGAWPAAGGARRVRSPVGSARGRPAVPAGEKPGGAGRRRGARPPEPRPR